MWNILETSSDSSGRELQQAVGTNGDGASSAISLVLAGHHPLTLCGLSQVFEKEPACSVLAVCTDVEAALDAVRRYQPEILILDLDRNAALTALRRVQRERLPTRVVVLASASDDSEMVDAMRLGASAIIQKELPPEAFVRCVQKVHRGEHALEGPGVERLVTRLSRSGLSTRHVSRQLTPREAEIARLAARGVSTKDIAARLAVKQGTVKIHLHSIYEKLNVGGRLGLILFARRHGLA